ncbi:MAG: hypothetical protein QM736_19755 [Vicinamibacterales bacterium]
MRNWSIVWPTLVAAVAVLDPFAFFQPTLRFDASDRQTLAKGAAIARTVAAPAGNVGIVAAVPIKIDGQRLIAWMRDIGALKKSAVVKQIGRFSPTPSLADVSGLTLEPADLDDLTHCRPDDCGLKLTSAEIAGIQKAAAAAGRDRTRREAAMHRAFRDVIVARATDYLQDGRSGPEPPAFLAANWPQVARAIRDYPHGGGGETESFMYWSKDAYAGTPIISITHLTIVHGLRPGDPEVLVIGRQVFATHYTDASWSFTALVRDERTPYLVYVNQSAIDLLDTWYGGLIRRTVERRLRTEAVDVLEGLRRRLESGNPPGTPAR